MKGRLWGNVIEEGPEDGRDLEGNLESRVLKDSRQWGFSLSRSRPVGFLIFDTRQAWG